MHLMNAILNKTNNGKLIAAVAVLALIACAFMAVGVASEESDGAPTSQMTGEEFLKEASQGVITLDKNVELTSQVMLTGSLTVNLNGFTLSSTEDVSNMFCNAGTGSAAGTNNVDLVINGEKTGSAIDASKRITFFRADECSLTVTGGTYTAGDYGFIWYAANTLANNIIVSNVKIDSTMAAFWLSNRAIENAVFTNCEITSDFMGIYFGTVQEATITNCDISVSGTNSSSAVEIKAGNVTFDGCTITSTKYTASNNVSTNGNGESESAITINNGYNASAGTTAVNVIVKNSTITNSATNSKPVILTSVNDNPIFFAWEGHDAYDVAITGINEAKVTVGTVSGEETSVEASTVDDANTLLASGAVDKVVLTGKVDASNTQIFVPKDKTLVIADDTTITGTNINPIKIANGGYVEVNTASSASKTFKVVGGPQTNGVNFINVSGDFVITGGSVHVEGNISGTIQNNGETDVSINGTIDGDLTITGTGTVTFDNATITNNAVVTLDDKVTYEVVGDMRLYGEIQAVKDNTNNATINVKKSTNPENTFTAYASATIGKGVIVTGTGKIDIGAAMSNVSINDDIESDAEWSQSQKVTVTDSITIKSGWSMTVLGELIINEGCSITVEEGATLTVGSRTAIATGVVVDGTIEVDKGGIFTVEKAIKVTVSGDIVSSGTFTVNSKVTVKNGGSIAIEDAEGSSIVVSANNDFVIENGGSLDISATMSISGITNKGTITLDGAIIAPNTEAGVTNSIIIMGADGAVVNVDSFTHNEANMTITGKGMVAGKDADKNDVVIGTTTGTKVNNIVFKGDKDTGIEGLVVTSSVTSETIDKKVVYTNTLLVSGNVDIVDDRVVAAGQTATAFDYTLYFNGGEGITVPAESTLNLGDNVIVQINRGVLNVDGDVIATGDLTSANQSKGQIVSGGSVDIYVSGLITAEKEIDSAMVNAFHYTGTDANKYEYYTTLVNAVANSAKIDYHGDVDVEENVTIPADAELSAGENAGTITVGSTEDRTVTLTVANTATLKNCKIDVYGTVIIENAKKDLKGGNITSDVTITEEPKVTYTNIYTALNNAESGEVKITRTGTPVILDKDIEVKSGVTLVIPSGAVVTILDRVTLTVNGTVENSGSINNARYDAATENYVAGNGFNPVKDGKTNTDAAEIVVNGAFKSIEFTAYDTATGSSINYYIPGAYYQIIDTEGAWYYITPVEQAAAVSNSVEDDIVIYGEVSVGDVDFTGDKDQYVSVIVDGKLTANTVSVSYGTFQVIPGAQFDGTVDSALGSIAFVNAANFTVTDSFDADKVETMSVLGSPIQADKDGAESSMTIASGNIAVVDVAGLNIVDTVTVYAVEYAGIENFAIAAGATLTVTGQGVELFAGEMTVDGTLVATDYGSVDVDTLTVRGTFNIESETDDHAAGQAKITTLLVGIAQDEDYPYKYVDASAAAVTSDVAIVGLSNIYVSAESTVTGDMTKGMNSTEFYVEDALWMTVYVKSSTTGFFLADEKTYNFQPGDLVSSEFVSWNTADGDKVVVGKYIGTDGYQQVYANINYNVYNVVITLDNTVGSVAIDGQMLVYDSDLGGYVLPGGQKLTAGQHTVTYTLAANYEGTPTLTSQNVAVSGLTFTLSGDFKGENAQGNIETIDYYLSLGGATLADTSIVIEGGNGGSDSLGLTDYLLIILVVLIVIMAIMVAMRLMRS
ncbi:MAG: hypothetical protein A3205_04530 [Methanomassiliicoccales archaeon Mx-03]|nr:MAG: hypothetical protein A3205_04530 [Methanomassiliicoccales archaeon Mx-03]